MDSKDRLSHSDSENTGLIHQIQLLLLARSPQRTTPNTEVKPQPLQHGPTDTLGLGSVLPADKLIMLRRLIRMDPVTEQKSSRRLGSTRHTDRTNPTRTNIYLKRTSRDALHGFAWLGTSVIVIAARLRMLMTLIPNMSLVTLRGYYSCTVIQNFIAPVASHSTAIRLPYYEYFPYGMEVYCSCAI